MNIETEKIGVLKVRKNGLMYSLTDVTTESKKRKDIYKMKYYFEKSTENIAFIKELCRLLNRFHKAKTFNEHSVVKTLMLEEEYKVGKRLRKNNLANAIYFSKFLVWAFPEYDNKAKEIAHDYVYIHLDDPMLKDFIGWLKSRYDELFDGQFDPLCFLREVVLVKMFMYDGSDEKILSQVIELNRSLIEVKLPFKERMIVITRFFK